MKYSQALIAMLLSIFIIVSCTKEGEPPIAEIRNDVQETSSTDIVSISPPTAVIHDIKQEIVNSSILTTEFGDLSNSYGEFFWNKATYQPAADDKSITCIPSEKDDQLTGMILVFQHEGHRDFSFIDLSLVMHVIQNNEEVDDFEFLAIIFSLQNMMYYRYRYIHPQLDSYINDYIENNQIQVRSVSYAVEWIITVTDKDGNVKHTYTETRWHLRDCSGSGGFGGPIFTNGPPSTTGFLPTDGDPDKWKTKTIVDNDEDEDIDEDIVECLDHSICNELFNHINNLAGDYIIDHCTNKSASDLVIDILTEICSHNVGDNTSIGAEGSGTSNVICDQVAFDEMWDEAMADVDEEFNEFIEELKDVVDCSGQFSDDINEVIAQSNCNMDDFTAAFNNYYGITETLDDQTTAPVLCLGGQVDTSLFSVSNVQDGIHVSAGITDFRFQVTNSQNQTITIYHPYIQLLAVRDLSQCPDKTHAGLMAQALNLAVTQFRDLMQVNISQDNLDPLTEKLQDFVSFHLDNLTKGCSNNGTSTSVISVPEIGGYQAACGTVFTTFNQSHINDCN